MKKRADISQRGTKEKYIVTKSMKSQKGIMCVNLILHIGDILELETLELVDCENLLVARDINIIC